MNSEVDQFGRSTNNSDVLNDDKSKRILEALSDIKSQLQNDEFIPKVEKENISRTKDIKKDTNHDPDFKNLHYKIASLEKKINQIVENLQNNQKGGLKLKKEEELEEEDQSIFHKIEKFTRKDGKTMHNEMDVWRQTFVQFNDGSLMVNKYSSCYKKLPYRISNSLRVYGTKGTII